jgi:hypothetical protein
VTGLVLDETQQALAAQATTGMPDSREIFDAGSHGLRFFESFTPVYNKCARAGLSSGSTVDYKRDIVAPYDEQREVAFAKLYAEADRLDHAHTELLACVDRLGAHHDQAREVWRSAAAEVGTDRHTDIATGAKTLADRVGTLVDALTEAVTALERACHTKAAGTEALFADQVGGLSADQLDQLVSVAAGPASDADLHQAAHHCGIEVDPAFLAGLPTEHKDALRADIRNWLSTAFIAVYQARRAAFDRLIAEAREQIANAWKGLDIALGPLDPGSTSPSADPATATHPPETSPGTGHSHPVSAQAPSVPFLGIPGAAGTNPDEEHQMRVVLEGHVFDDADDADAVPEVVPEDDVEESFPRQQISAVDISPDEDIVLEELT